MKKTIIYLCVLIIIIDLLIIPAYLITDYKILISTGDSMCNDSPTIVVYDTNPEQYDVGDVVIFNRDDGLTVRHRLIEDKHNPDNYVTKGDCNDYRDYGLNYKNSIEKEELETYLKGKQIASYELPF